MQIDHQCPQCGGSVILEETDRVLQCSFCKTRLSIQSKDYFRYLFPFPNTIEEEIIFVPYWRFRGMYFSCRTAGIKTTVIDKSFPALDNKALPVTLGIRPQSLKLKFAQKTERARFIEPRLPFEKSSVETKNRLSYEIITTHGTRFISIDDGNNVIEVPETRTEMKEDKLYYESFVADKVSVIYTPLFIRSNTIYDAILTKPISNKVDLEELLSGDASCSDWIIQFLPTLCPNCGWDLVAERDSCILLCNHCNRAWEVSQGTFQPVKYAIALSDNPQQKVTHLPFWKIKVIVDGINLKSHGDLLKLANLSRVVQEEQTTSDLYFWVPAFKIAPPIFLRTARQVTTANPQKELQEEFRNISWYPVNVTLSEAIESLKVVFIDIARNKKDLIPRLEKITITPVESLLVFHPFIDSNYELIEPEIKYGLMKNALKWGKNL
jgi:ribosomal protein L37AE/L43A